MVTVITTCTKQSNYKSSNVVAHMTTPLILPVDGFWMHTHTHTHTHSNFKLLGGFGTGGSCKSIYSSRCIQLIEAKTLEIMP